MFYHSNISRAVIVTSLYVTDRECFCFFKFAYAYTMYV